LGALVIFDFKLEPGLRLLTAVRTGVWSLNVVRSYEAALRRELAALHLTGPETAFVIDIRASGAQPKDVAKALRVMVEGLGPLHASKVAIVTSSGLAKLEARQMGNPSARTFTSMVLARDWILQQPGDVSPGNYVHNRPSTAEPQHGSVHVFGPADVDVTLTPSAALETAKRIGAAATEAVKNPEEFRSVA
jgi:hypothetical protein